MNGVVCGVAKDECRGCDWTVSTKTFGSFRTNTLAHHGLIAEQVTGPHANSKSGSRARSIV